MALPPRQAEELLHRRGPGEAPGVSAAGVRPRCPRLLLGVAGSWRTGRVVGGAGQLGGARRAAPGTGQPLCPHAGTLRPGTTASCAETEVSRAGGAQEGARKEHCGALRTCGASAVLSASFPLLSPWQVGQFARPRKLLETERHLCPSRAPRCHFRCAHRTSSGRAARSLPLPLLERVKSHSLFPCSQHFYRALSSPCLPPCPA